MNCWEPFTKEVREIISRSTDEALKFGNEQIDIPHFLLAIIFSEQTNKNFLSELMKKKELSYEKILVLFKSLGLTKGNSSQIQSFTFSMKRVIEKGFEWARETSSDFIDINHLILGIIDIDKTYLPSLIIHKEEFEQLVIKLKNVPQDLISTPNPTIDIENKQMGAKIHFSDDILLGYLRYTFPGKYVVVVNMDFEDNGSLTKKTEYVINILADMFGKDSKEISDYLLTESIFFVGETEEEAHAIYEKFPEEKAPYAHLFGPIDVKTRKKFRKKGLFTDESNKQLKDGMWLCENT